MKVVFNIDDYGYSLGEIEGAIYAYQKGIISSTTALMTVKEEFIKKGVEQSKLNPGFGIGCHLCLTYGKPLTDAKSFVDENGNLCKAAKWNNETLTVEEIYKEYKAQVEKFIAEYGHKPTHLDHHHNVQLHNDKLYEAYVKVANEYGLPYRDLQGPIPYLGMEYYDCSFDVIKKYVKKDSDETIELASHCAFVDRELFENTSWDAMRISELRVATNKETIDFLKENNVTIIDFQGNVKEY